MEEVQEIGGAVEDVLDDNGVDNRMHCMAFCEFFFGKHYTTNLGLGPGPGLDR